MYQVSDNYKSKIYEASTKHLLKVYINGVKIEERYVKACKPSFILFTGNEFTLGSTVAIAMELQINKIAVPENIERVFVESGIQDEVIPIGYFRLDEPMEVNKNVCTLKLIDDMVKFEANYDGSTLTYPAKLIDVLQDICLKIGVELRFYFFFKYE